MTDDDDDDERPSGRGMGGDVLFDAGAAEGLNAQHGQGPAGSVGSGAGASVAMSEREGAQREIEEMERERERDRMRKREEEADLDGWGTSGEFVWLCAFRGTVSLFLIAQLLSPLAFCDSTLQ